MRYTVLDSNQEVLDKVAVSIKSRYTEPVELRLKSKDGDTRKVTFLVDGTGHDALGELIMGKTVKEFESINISIPKDGEPTAHLRT